MVDVAITVDLSADEAGFSTLHFTTYLSSIATYVSGTTNLQVQ